MDEWNFFDCSCSVGKRKIIYPGSFWSSEELIRRMDRYGISKALVYHALAREYHPVEGNRLLLETIRNEPRLRPVWVVMPHHTDEFIRPPELLQAMKTDHVRAARLFPSPDQHLFSLAGWNCGELLSLLEEHRVPVLLGKDQATWEELYNLLGNHPDLRLILTDVNYRINRNLYPLLEKFPNLHIETIGYKVCDGIADLCRRFGAKRLIFGSGMPLYSGAAAVAMITYAAISSEEKQLIASGNLENLLGGVIYD